MNITIKTGFIQNDILKNRQTVVLSYYVDGEKRVKYTRVYNRDKRGYEKLKKWIKKKKTQIKKELSE